VTVHRERRDLPIDDPWVDTVTIEVHRPSRPRGAAVLLTHGAGKDLDAPHLVALADAIAGEGHLTVRANQPWKQAGRGAPPPPHLAVPGFTTVAATVRTTYGPRRSWIVGGHSNGARIVTHALADPDHEVRATGVLLVSYPLHPPGTPEKLRVEHWPDVPQPVLVLQGTADRFGGADELRPHLSAFPGGARVHEVQGADHGWAVPSTRSADGRRHEPDEVAAGLGPVVGAWLADVAAR
jgi:predicted alpha/beta-hydrolase family hydrolase